MRIVQVCGFKDGNNLYPLSFVANADAAFFSNTSTAPLTLVVAPTKTDLLSSFPLAKGRETVNVTRSNLALISFVREKMAGISPELLASTLADYAQRDGYVEKEGFDATIRQLVPVHRFSESEKLTLSGALTKIFFAFDREGLDASQANELLVGLTSLSGLLPAFRMCDADGDGLIDPDEFRLFTTAILTVVLALNDSITQLPADYVAKLIDDSVNPIVEKCFPEADANRDGLLSWVEFSSWFKRGGHMQIPWASLMDVVPNSKMLQELHEDALGIGGREDDEADDDSAADELVYEFALAPGHGSLVVTRADIVGLELLVTTTGLCKAPVDKVLGTFVAAADADGYLTKLAFDNCVRLWVPSNKLSKDEQAYLSYVLSNLFFAFDRGGKRTVRVDEFCSGFSLLCAGSKSRKLQYTFTLFDKEGSGKLPVLDFARYLRSILTVLFALNEAAAAKPAQMVYEAIDKTSALAVRALLQTLPGPTKTITFEDLARFYNTNNGHRLMPYIELLDLSKFTMPRGASGREEPESSAAQQQLSEGEAEVVFSFSLLGDRSLEVLSTDSMRLKLVLDLCKFHLVSPEVIHKRLAAASERGGLSKAAYDQVIAELLDGKVFGVRERALLGVTFNNVFYAYDREGTNIVRVKELASGMSLFSSGKKSEKLMLAFNVFDTDRDGLLSREDVARFLRSFLTIIFALTESAATHPAEYIWETVDGAALDLADEIFAGNRAGKASFDDIALWYGNGGFKRASFLELIDVQGKKWPFELDNDANSKPEHQQQQQQRQRQRQSASKDAAEAEKPEAVFLFTISKTDRLEISTRDVAHVKQIVISTGLDQIPPPALYDALKSQSDGDKISREAYDQVKERLILKHSDGSDVSQARRALGLLFQVCDRDGVGEVPLKDLLGITLLAQGNKSLKLAFAWSTMDSNNDGRLDRRELFALLRAFLVMLEVLCYDSNRLPFDRLFKVVDEASTELAATIFVGCSRRKKDSVSFEEFAQYYSEGGGYAVAAHLELLNLHKFVVDSTTSGGGSSGSSSKAAAAAASADASTGSDDDLVFAFELCPGEVLHVMNRDVNNVQRLIKSCSLCDMTPEEVVRLVGDFVGTKTVDRADVMLLVDRFGYKQGASEEDKALVMDTIMRLYQSLVQPGTQSCPVETFSVALSVLASGSKSPKLVLGWWALCSQQEDAGVKIQLPDADRAALERYMSTWLTAVFSLVTAKKGDEQTRAGITRAVKETCDRIYTVVDANPQHTLSFEQFGQWYSASGHENSSWLELLCLAKWREN